MVHSIELLLDADTESALRSPGSTSLPHVTMVVADAIATEVDALLAPLCARFPMECVIGAPMLFGRSTFVVARLVVPSADLLAIHREVHRICAPHLTPGAAPNALPGRWTPHVTLARRVDAAHLARVMTDPRLTREHIATLVGMRHWDGDKRAEHLIT